MDKMNKLTLPATILLASVILGGFYYASQVSKQKSIENQQKIKLQEGRRMEERKTEQEKADQLAKELKEQQVKEEAEEQVKLNRQLLDNCLVEAQSKWLEWGNIVKEKSKRCDTLTGGTRSGCLAVYLEAFKENDVQLQQDKAECFKRYPQR